MSLASVGPMGPRSPPLSKIIFSSLIMKTKHYGHWHQSALNSAGAFSENFGEFSPQKPTYAHFIL